MTTQLSAFFVYGTLQRGEVRDGMWPAPPISICWATTRGRLYDLGPYPALAEGDDLVRGELWQIAPGDLLTTLEKLDEIECFGQDGVDLYVRREVECRTDDGHTHRAFAYFIADPQTIAGAALVTPQSAGWCRWSRHAN